MSKRHYKGRDKLTHKMTRDGLVEVNAVTGEETRVSQRGQDFDLRQGQVQSTGRTIEQQSRVEHGRRQSPPSAASEQTAQSSATADRQADYRQETQSPQDLRHADAPRYETPYQSDTPYQSSVATSADHSYKPQAVTTQADTTQQTTKRHHQQRATEQSRFEDSRQYAVDNPQQPSQSPTAYSAPNNTTSPAYTAQDTKPYVAPAQETPPQSPSVADTPYTPAQNIPHTADIPYTPSPTNSAPLSSYGALLSKRHVDEPVESAYNPTSQWRDTDIPQANTAPTQTSGRSRLQYSDGQPQATASAKPRQHGTKYQQEFASHVEAQNPTGIPQGEAPHIRKAADIPISPLAETPTSTTQVATHSSSAGKLSTGKSRLQYSDRQPQAAASAKPRQHGTRYQQEFAPYVEAQSSTDVPQGDVPHVRQAADIPVSPIADTSHSAESKVSVHSSSAGKLSTDNSRLQFADGEPQAADTAAKPQQHGTKYQRDFAIPDATTEALSTATADKPTDKAPPKPDGDKPPKASTDKQSRLQFSKDEQAPELTPADKKLKRAQQKAEKVQSKLDKARERLPHKKKPKIERTFDDAKGKVKHKLKFEKEVIPKGYKKPVPKPVGAAKSLTSKGTLVVAGKFHQKMYQVEHENVGVKTGHRVEQVGEVAFRGIKRVTRSTYRFIKEHPYRTVAKLEKQATKANIKLAYQKSLRDNPKLKSNLLSRFVQKQKIKRQYAKAAKEAKRAAKAAKKTGGIVADATKAVAGFVSRHPDIAAIIIGLALILIFIMTMFGSCSNMATGILSSMVGTSYAAEDKDIDDSELYYTEWETDLQLEIQNAEAEHPGYDEYRYNVGEIGHNPFELMAYLTAVYQDFKYSNVQAALRAIFNEQYTLTFVEEVEVRYRTETHTDPETGESYDVEVPYNWYILNVNLTSKPFTDVIMPKMNAEQLQMYNLYMITKGNRQYLSNVFDVNWLPYVSSYYGYRVHPISGVKDYHKGIDIALPTGTQIKSGQDGRVTFAGWSGDYGYLVVIENDKGLVSKYAHCNSVLVSNGQTVKQGDPIATVGSTGNSTGPHLHLEIIKDGQYLNPIYFAVTGDDGSGSIPPGSPGGVPIPPDPGSPMGDGSYAALIAEAERYLGFPYVWGGSSPSTSFDCSGYVSWCLNRSGVASVGRSTAQGLFNLCTPVSAANAKPGDLIFFTGTYSSSNPVTHVGIYVGGGMMIHCGDPISYASINTSYWQNHFYAFGRIN